MIKIFFSLILFIFFFYEPMFAFDSTRASVQITSSPTNANVFLDSFFQGRTPISLSFSETNQKISLYSASIRSWNLPPVIDSVNSNDVAETLQRHFLFQNIPLRETKTISLLNTEHENGFSSSYVVGAATIFSGGVAAYSKIHADKIYLQYKTEYDETGIRNGELRRNYQRSDAISAIALLLTEIGFVYLSYTLLNF